MNYPKTIAILVAGLLVVLGAAALAQPTWRGLVVADESECAPYDSNDYRYDRDSIMLHIWMQTGAFFSPYDDRVYDIKEVDVEHRVSRHQAHVSGLCEGSAQMKLAFARDPHNLTVAEKHLNREVKGDKDAAGWLPPKNQCHFAAMSVFVKCAWRLTVDGHEAAVLEDVLSSATCKPHVHTLKCRKIPKAVPKSVLDRGIEGVLQRAALNY